MFITSASTMPASAETKIIGFGSFIAGRVTEGDQFLAGFPNACVYDNDWAIAPDTILGFSIQYI